MNKDYLKHLIRTDCFGLLSGVAKSFNKAVVDLAVKGENNFTTEMLVDMVTAQFYDNEKQKEAIMFCFDKIAEALTKPVQVMRNYIPELSNEWPNWAIDSNGEAYYYKTKPNKHSMFWSGSDWIMDEEFDKEKFKSMWADGSWETSLVENTVEDYIPNFKYEQDSAWAIDEDGCAYFYREKYPERVSSGWRSDEFYHMDDNFDADKYPRMWLNGAWRNSLKCK